MKRILIDGRFIGVGDSMTRYCLEIVKGILDQDKDNEYTLLIRPEGEKILKVTSTEILHRKGTESVIARSGFATWQSNNLTIKVLDIPHYSLGEQTKLLSYLNKEKFDLVHFIQFNHPILYRGKYVVTIHDLTLFGHLYREKLHKKIAFDKVMRSAVNKSAKIITVSETSKNDIIDNYHVDPNKIAVTYLGVDGKYNCRIKNDELRIKQFKEKHGIVGDYILYTGMWKKHKNLIRLLKAFEKFQETRNNNQTNSNYQIPNIQLVLVGKVDKNEPEVIKTIEEINKRFCHPERAERVEGSSNKINNKISNIQYPTSNEISNSQPNKLRPNAYLPVITTGFVEEEELPISYAGALFYVIPSLSEGFGLPPLEAMACGTPVISSNISAMPEILGDAALYFDPYDVCDIAEKMRQMADNTNLREDYSQKGLEQAGKYSWENTAKRTLVVYKELLDS
ncbi:MAG: Capsular glucan synthase [bacterium ADurb.Bin212]|nr:MAG: Capsular glucan synthase [bacterium ADurb.Bin212]